MSSCSSWGGWPRSPCASRATSPEVPDQPSITTRSRGAVAVGGPQGVMAAKSDMVEGLKLKAGSAPYRGTAGHAVGEGRERARRSPQPRSPRLLVQAPAILVPCGGNENRSFVNENLCARGGWLGMARHILALDQGTTSTRAILFDAEGHVVASAQRELQQLYPADGWVEHDPERHLADALAVCREALAAAGGSRPAIAAIGITNQRETAVALGPGDRPADPQRHRLAGPAHRRLVPRAASPTALEEHVRASAPAWCSTPISPPPSSPGCSTTCRARAPRPSAASSPSARSTASCSGG